MSSADQVSVAVVGGYGVALIFGVRPSTRARRDGTRRLRSASTTVARAPTRPSPPDAWVRRWRC